MAKDFLKVISLCVTVLVLVCTLSCDSGSSSGSGVGGTGVPAEVAETAEGIFGMIDEYMMVEELSSESYPSGLSVVANSEEKYTMTLTDFSPEEGVSVSGELVLEHEPHDPCHIGSPDSGGGGYVSNRGLGCIRDICNRRSAP